MTISSDKLEGANGKLQRANKHLFELKEAIKAFGKTSPYKTATKYDEKRNCAVYFIAKADNVPDEIRLIAGDVIQNLRGALDHIAMQLWIDGGSQGNVRSVTFPIYGSADKYKSSAARRIIGARQELQEYIDTIQPYRGGRAHILWQLHELSIIDKHRLLIVVGACLDKVDLTDSFRYVLRKQFDMGDDQEVPVQILAPQNDTTWTPKCPLNVGDELFGNFPGVPLDFPVKITLDLAFAESEIAPSLPLMKTLETMSDYVYSLICDLRPRLK